MRSVTYSMGVSLDGYIVGPDGGFDWTAPDEEVFRFVTDEIRQVGVHLLGRRLYETMLYWETADQDPSLDDSMLEWAALWKALPKVVFSTTLPAVQGHARLASAGLAEEIEAVGRAPRDRLLFAKRLDRRRHAIDGGLHAGNGKARRRYRRAAVAGQGHRWVHGASRRAPDLATDLAQTRGNRDHAQSDEPHFDRGRDLRWAVFPLVAPVDANDRGAPVPRAFHS